ncbi:TPA: conjugal transfer protein [Escherichia coli]|nr:conjugal transfer protein [Escherichia coli]
MASINTIVKRKQYLWLGIVVVGTASAIGGALYLSDVDMSGTVTSMAQVNQPARSSARMSPSMR